MCWSPFSFHVDVANSTIVPVDGESFAPDEQCCGDKLEIWLDHGLVTVKLASNEDGQLAICLIPPHVNFDDAEPESFDIDTTDLDVALASFGRLWRNADHPKYVYLSLGEQELHIKAEADGLVFDLWDGDDVVWTAACAFEDIGYILLDSEPA